MCVAVIFKIWKWSSTLTTLFSDTAIPSAESSSDTAMVSMVVVNFLGARTSCRTLSPKYSEQEGSHSVAFSKNSFRSFQLPYYYQREIQFVED